VKSPSLKYGPAVIVTTVADTATKERYDAREEPIAWWEDSPSSVNLVGSGFSGGFNLLIASKRLGAEAERALAEAARLDKQAPQREADRQKKEIDDLELTRQKNQKSFRP
jgi:hypothetical protein